MCPSWPPGQRRGGVLAALLCDGRNRVAPLGQGVAEVSARADPELHEHLLQVPLDCAEADEELGPDFRVRAAGEGESGDVLLRRGELVAGVVSALADGLAGR